MQWEIDPILMHLAAKELQLTKPVTIKIGFDDQRWGFHKFNETTNSHLIFLNQEITPVQANETLWHELEHARQTEDETRDKFSDVYNTELDNQGYNNSRYEMNAREFASKMAQKYPLVVPVI